MDAIIKDLGLLINATLIATPPLLLAALGSCFTERSGTVNIGIEGMMTIGAFTGAVVGLETGNGWLAFLCAGLAGAVLGVILAIACISFHADQTIARYSYQLPWPGSCHLPLQGHVQQLHGYTGNVSQFQTAQAV